MSFARTQQTNPTPEQWERALRWEQRLHRLAAAGAPPDDLLDHALVVLQHCFSMRDWLVNSGVGRKPEVHKFFSTVPDLELCRDVVNGSKHLRVDHPSVDPKHLTVQEYVPGPVGAAPGVGSSFRLLVLYNQAQDRMDLMDFCTTCVHLVRGFLDRTAVLAVPNRLRIDFAQRAHSAPSEKTRKPSQATEVSTLPRRSKLP